MEIRAWFLVSFLGCVGSASAQQVICPQPIPPDACAPRGLPASCTGVSAMSPIEVPFCARDRFPGDVYAGCTCIAAHYLVVPPACNPWGTGLFPVMVFFRGVGNGISQASTACCVPPPFLPNPNQHWTPYEGPHADLMEEASKKGWYAVSLLGLPDNQYCYGAPQYIYGAEKALKDFLTKCADADKDRIVGVGFSLGGTNVLSYAARHLDPQGPYGMFAATVVLAGVTSNSYRWASGNESLKNVIQGTLNLPTCTSAITCAGCAWSPQNFPLAYQQSCGVFTGCNFIINPGDELTSFARNLLHIPVWGLIHQQDGVTNAHMDLLDDVMIALGAPRWFYNATSVNNSTFTECQHCWNVYKGFPLAFGGADLFTLIDGERLSQNLPTQAHVLVGDNPAPEEAVDRYYFHFRPTRSSTSTLGQFHWQIEAGAENRLTLKDVDNLGALRARTGTGLYASQLVTASTLKVKLVQPLVQHLDVVLEGYANPPQLVTRVTHVPGMPDLIEFMSSPQDWVHASGTLTLKQDSFTTYDKTWIVTP